MDGVVACSDLTTPRLSLVGRTSDGPPIPTAPSIRVILEIVEGCWPTLDSWLSRPLTREHVAALSPEARRERKRARVRVCKLKARRASLDLTLMIV